MVPLPDYRTYTSYTSYKSHKAPTLSRGQRP